MITVVQKHLEANKTNMKPGTIVDSSGWRNEALLIEQRRLRLANDTEKKDFYKQNKQDARA